MIFHGQNPLENWLQKLFAASTVCELLDGSVHSVCPTKAMATRNNQFLSNRFSLLVILILLITSVGY